MKMSTKGRYGLRSVLDLAVNSVNEHVSLKSIAERQHISEGYLEQIFSTLRKSGIVKSVKGMQGGYMLTEPAANITVGKVLRALEGDLSIVEDDVKINDFSDRAEYCISKNVWSRINNSIEELVESITLEDLVYQYKNMNDNQFFMYYI